MDKEDISALAARLIEIMIDPTRDPLMKGRQLSVEERNECRRGAGEHLQNCVDYLVGYIENLEMGEELADLQQRYATDNIGDEKATAQ